MSLDFSESPASSASCSLPSARCPGCCARSILNASVLAVAAGVGLAAIDVVSVDSESDTAPAMSIELALLLTLFSDGLVVERELLAEHWGPPARALIIAMPLTLGLLAACRAGCCSRGSTGAECFLLGAVLSPTDPVVTSTVVTSRARAGSRAPDAQHRVGA